MAVPLENSRADFMVRLHRIGMFIPGRAQLIIKELANYVAAAQECETVFESIQVHYEGFQQTARSH